MDFKKFGPKLKQIKLFQDLNEEQLNHLISGIKEISLAPGEYLIKEGDAGTDFFFVEKGEVEILKENPSGGHEISLATQGEGRVIGELAMLEGGKREASVRAVKPTLVLAISIHKRESDPIYKQIQLQITKFLSQKIKEGNLILIETVNSNMEHFQARSGLANLIVHLLIVIFLYIFAVRLILVLKINVISTSLISVPVLLVFGISMLMIIKANGFPLSLYGVTWKGSKQAIVEGIIFSLPLFAFITFSKWAAINWFPRFHDLKLFHISPALQNGVAPPTSIEFAILVILYAIFVPIQELIFRGAIQSSLQQFLLGKHKTLQAILISNLPFCMIHLHLSLTLTFFVYFFGVFWGWMFSRQKTLVGCSLSHFLLGSWAFFIVGIQDFLVV